MLLGQHMFTVMGCPGLVVHIGFLAIEAPCVFSNKLIYFECCVTHGSLSMGPRQDCSSPDLPVLLKNQFLLAEVVEGLVIRTRVWCRARAVRCRQDQESESRHQAAAL